MRLWKVEDWSISLIDTLNLGVTNAVINIPDGR